MRAMEQLAEVVSRPVGKTYTEVNISHSIDECRPRETAIEHLTNRLVLLLLKNCIRDARLVSTKY